ncbi:MAG: hypothetical protein HQL71_15380 [Magnetococcales bacterium]|nr:hypothetical protein [Magnetococcales bacterium]
MKIKSTIISGVLAGLFFSSTLSASAPVYRQGCEFPIKGVEVCWEATGSSNIDFAPYAELHMLPLAKIVAGEEQVFADTTRKIYRQLLPSSLAERIIPEWTPVYHLEDAVTSGQDYGWPAYMWISPRAMRNSSEMSPGLVDWDVYFFSNDRLARTLRIRVESKPKISDNKTELMTATGAGAIAFTNLSPIATAAAVIASGSMATPNPPEAGRSLDLLTELATRQILYLAQYPINNLKSPDVPKKTLGDTVKEGFKDWSNKIFSPK